MFRGLPTPAQFFDEEIPRLVERGGASSERRADVIFEIVGPEGGRWCLHLGKQPSAERVDPWVQGQLLVRMDEALFPSFLDASLELEPAISDGRLALAGDVDLLGDLAEMWNEPMSQVSLRAKKDRES